MFDRVREDYHVHGRHLAERVFWAMLHYRFGQWAMKIRCAPLRWVAGRVYGALAIIVPIVTGVQIDRRMVVGRRFHIIHGGMVGLHPGARFGNDCGVMHGVTVGTNMVGGAPVIGNDVFIGCGATILGEITIGDGVRIAANSLVVSDVPAGAMAIGVPAKIYAGRGHGKAAEEARRALDARLHPASPPQPAAAAMPTVVAPSSTATFRGAPSENDATVR